VHTWGWELLEVRLDMCLACSLQYIWVIFANYQHVLVFRFHLIISAASFYVGAQSRLLCYVVGGSCIYQPYWPYCQYHQSAILPVSSIRLPVSSISHTASIINRPVSSLVITGDRFTQILDLFRVWQLDLPVAVSGKPRFCSLYLYCLQNLFWEMYLVTLEACNDGA